MRNFNLIRSILSEPWYLSIDEATKLNFLFTAIFNPEARRFEPPTRYEAARLTDIVLVSRGETEPGIKVGIVYISGVLCKYDPACGFGMETYGRLIQDFGSTPDIDALVLATDTPGGSVAGMEELTTIIKTVGASKPIVAYVSDMAASCGYWIASCCREIIANHATATVGSIGVMCTIQDMSEYFEKQGIKIHDIYAPQSKDKNQEYHEVKKGKFDLTKERLSVYAERFHAVVRENRPNVTDDQLTGKVYFAGDVVGTLVDGIGTLQYAITRAAELVEAPAASTALEQTNQTNIDMSKPKTSLAALAAAAGVEAFETADGSIALTAEQADAVEAVMAAATSAMEAVQQTVTQTQSALTTAQAENQTLAARIAELEKGSGAPSASVAPAADGDGTPSGEMSFGEAFTSCTDFLKR